MRETYLRFVKVVLAGAAPTCCAMALGLTSALVVLDRNSAEAGPRLIMKPAYSEGGKMPESEQSDVARVSMMQLIANPRAYHNRVVAVRGTLAVGFENNILYFHKEDYDKEDISNAIWINIPRETREKQRENDGKHVEVIGRFSSTDRGHRGAFIGAIDAAEINRVE